jgi:hypothetical protein
VEEQKRFQEFKLSDSKVSASSGLLSFLTEDTNTNVSLKDHTNIIGTVTNGKCGLFWEAFLNEVNNISFLLW